MTIYRYIAMAPEGGLKRRGELSADSAQQVRTALRRMNLLPMRVTEKSERGKRRFMLFGAAIDRVLRSRRRAALVELYESLAALLASGTALASALELLASGRSKNAALCRELAECVKSGGSLSAAMSERPEWFSVIDAALVGSAEESGETEAALLDLAEHHGRAEELGGKLAGALAYPTLLFVFGLGVVVFLTTTTLPQLAAVIDDSGGTLPRSTRTLLVFGDVLTNRWPVALILLVGGFAGFFWLARTPRLASFRLRIPLLGRLGVTSQTADASLLLSRLLAGGLPLTEALSLVTPTVRNACLRDALDSLREQLKEGRAVAAALSATSFFDPVFCRVLEVGEASGELADSLRAVGERQRAMARRLIDRLATALEPAVILILAAMIGFVVYAAITPMLRLAQTIS